MKNKVEELARLLGGKAVLADTVERSAALISRWVRRGAIPPQYNNAIRTAAREMAGVISERHPEAWLAQVEACLDPAVCPTCGQAIEEGRIL